MTTNVITIQIDVSEIVKAIEQIFGDRADPVIMAIIESDPEDNGKPAEVAPAPAPANVVDEAVAELTIDALLEIAVESAKQHGRDKVVTVINGLGVDTLTALDSSRYDEAAAKLRSINA